MGEARVLDGFAGTGAVGIEALSRGAAPVTFVEADGRAVRLIQRNLDHCGVADRYAIIRARFADAVRGVSAGRSTGILDPQDQADDGGGARAARRSSRATTVCSSRQARCRAGVAPPS